MRRMRKYSVGILSSVAAFTSSLCCVLPLLVVLTGLGTGAFMMVTSRYRIIFLPAGVLGVAVSYALYLRERQRCRTQACQIIGARLNLVMLILSTLVVVAALLLDFFPDATASIFQQLHEQH